MNNTTNTHCRDCLRNALADAHENWTEDRGHEPTTDTEAAEVEQWAVWYVEGGDSTPCLRHRAA